MTHLDYESREIILDEIDGLLANADTSVCIAMEKIVEIHNDTRSRDTMLSMSLVKEAVLLIRRAMWRLRGTNLVFSKDYFDDKKKLIESNTDASNFIENCFMNANAWTDLNLSSKKGMSKNIEAIVLTHLIIAYGAITEINLSPDRSDRYVETGRYISIALSRLKTILKEGGEINEDK